MQDERGSLTVINWKVRFKNKVWLAAFLAALVTFIYQMFSMFGIVPPVSQEGAAQLVTIVLNFLVVMGVVVDPTTAGVTDSRQAMCYSKPKEEDQDGGL